MASLLLSPFFFYELPKSVVTGSLWKGSKGGRKTQYLYFLYVLSLYECVHILYVGVCSSAVSGGGDLVSSSITLDPFLWSRVFLCTWRLLAAYLSWSYRDVQDARLVMWVLGRELWSSWFHSKLSSPSYWCILKMWAWGRDIHIYVCMQVCLPMRVLRGQRSTPLSSFVAFLLYFLRWDLTETWAPRFQRGWLALSSLGLSQRRGSMWLLACSALAGHWDPNSAPRVSIANTSLTEPPWSSWF